MANTTVGVLALVANQLASWLTLNLRVRYHRGEGVCWATGSNRTVVHRVLVVEGGTPLAVLSASRKALTWLLRRVFKGIGVVGLSGISVGNVIFVRPGHVDDTELMRHECGHTEQAWAYGPLYIPLVGLFTIFGGWPIGYFEHEASRLGQRFWKLGRRGGPLTPREPARRWDSGR